MTWKIRSWRRSSSAIATIPSFTGAAPPQEGQATNPRTIVLAHLHRDLETNQAPVYDSTFGSTSFPKRAESPQREGTWPSFGFGSTSSSFHWPDNAGAPNGQLPPLNHESPRSPEQHMGVTHQQQAHETWPTTKQGIYAGQMWGRQTKLARSQTALDVHNGNKWQRKFALSFHDRDSCTPWPQTHSRSRSGKRPHMLNSPNFVSVHKPFPGQLHGQPHIPIHQPFHSQAWTYDKKPASLLLKYDAPCAPDSKVVNCGGSF